MKTNKYYVNEECIACRACVEVAGNNFEINDSNMAYLKKQPENEDEEKQCIEAMEVCPVEAKPCPAFRYQAIPETQVALHIIVAKFAVK